MHFDYEFSFIFPIHNEEAILANQIRIFNNFLEKSKIQNYEIILIENGSNDCSLKIIEDLAKKIKKLSFIICPKLLMVLLLKMVSCLLGAST